MWDARTKIHTSVFKFATCVEHVWHHCCRILVPSSWLMAMTKRRRQRLQDTPGGELKSEIVRGSKGDCAWFSPVFGYRIHTLRTVALRNVIIAWVERVTRRDQGKEGRKGENEKALAKGWKSTRIVCFIWTGACTLQCNYHSLTLSSFNIPFYSVYIIYIYTLLCVDIAWGSFALFFWYLSSEINTVSYAFRDHSRFTCSQLYD